MISRSIGLMRAARSRRWTRLELPRARVMPAVNITSHREDAYSRGTVEPEPSKSPVTSRAYDARSTGIRYLAHGFSTLA
jgi:hypothetical protein